ncbi:MAG: cytochrome c oxidase subunit II, partial [Gammaproteobacteria bacterium]|nr:cytochrome c oxidase subunit II [Gammaproteobacteria bacterium]
MNRIRLTPALTRSVLFLLLLAPAILAACMSNPQSTFDARGPVAEDQKNIFLFIFWIAAVVFILVEGALIYAIIRFRKKRPGPDLPKQVHGNEQLEIGLTIATILVLAVVAVPTVLLVFDQAEGPIDGKTPVDPLRVTAIGHQWWFEYEYDGEDVFTANELHIPVGRTTIVSLESSDVIHSFWAPKLGGKVDMIPGTTNELFLYTDEVGDFSGQCAEFC